MEWCWEQTQELPPVKWWLTRCAQRSITSLQIYSKCHTWCTETMSVEICLQTRSPVRFTSVSFFLLSVKHHFLFFGALHISHKLRPLSDFLISSFTISPTLLPSCCGAGTAADTQKTTDLLSSNLSIFSLNSGRNPRIVMAVNILQDMLYRFVLHTVFD